MNRTNPATAENWAGDQLIGILTDNDLLRAFIDVTSGDEKA